jgi:prephenate dehydrogenase
MIQRMTIIGVGLLGGSIGLAVKQRLNGCHIIGCAHREGSLRQAKELGAIDEWTLDPLAAVRGSDLVILCTPVSLIPHWLDRIAPELGAGAVVTDVGSTKAAIVAAGDRLIRPPARFVGSHPMAGSAQKGVSVARADLFEGATCIVTPSAATHPTAIQTVADFWRGLGMRIVQHDPAEHDRLVALVSHLPHAAAAALVAVQNDASIDLHGRGFLDSTRIAAGDAELWRDIFLDNRENVVAAVDQLITELTHLKGFVSEGRSADLVAWLQRNAATRDELDRGR